MPPETGPITVLYFGGQQGVSLYIIFPRWLVSSGLVKVLLGLSMTNFSEAAFCDDLCQVDGGIFTPYGMTLKHNL